MCLYNYGTKPNKKYENALNKMACTLYKYSTMFNIQYLGLVTRTLGPEKDPKRYNSLSNRAEKTCLHSLLKYYFQTT